MTRFSSYHLGIIFFLISLPFSLSGNTDTLLTRTGGEKDALLNGRIWWNRNSKVSGDPHFISDSYLKGSVTFNGQSFDNLDLKYDIFSDELVYRPESHPVIFLNKEMVDSFELNPGLRKYFFYNAGINPRSGPAGYVNLLYSGPTSLLVKYVKKIQPLADQGIYDLFLQVHRIFVIKDTVITSIDSRKQLFGLFEDRKKDVREYVKNHHLRLTLKEPGSLVPVLEFYDSLTR